jgi:hypothetical protein
VVDRSAGILPAVYEYEETRATPRRPVESCVLRRAGKNAGKMPALRMTSWPLCELFFVLE